MHLRLFYATYYLLTYLLPYISSDSVVTHVLFNIMFLALTSRRFLH